MSCCPVNSYIEACFSGLARAIETGMHQYSLDCILCLCNNSKINSHFFPLPPPHTFLSFLFFFSSFFLFSRNHLSSWSLWKKRWSLWQALYWMFCNAACRDHWLRSKVGVSNLSKGAAVGAGFHSNQAGDMPESTFVIRWSWISLTQVWLLLGWNKNLPPHRFYTTSLNTAMNLAYLNP